MTAQQQAAQATTQPVAVPKVSVWVSLVASFLGLIDAAYLTYEHYTASTTLACSDTGAINCLKVTTSDYSHLGPFPVALLGLVYFVAMAVLCLPWAWRSRMLGWVRLLAAIGGIVDVVYLVWAELFRLDAICLWCTGVHVLTFVLFGTVVLTPVPARQGQRLRG